MKKTFRREAETACKIIEIIEARMEDADLNLCVVREFCDRMLDIDGRPRHTIGMENLERGLGEPNTGL